jgi:DNA (cytosine-5)-methyltransferase 1
MSLLKTTALAAVLATQPGLIVDLFAGGGGASEGIEQGMERPVDIAANHDPSAIGMHTVNHPKTAHYEEDILTLDPKVATKGLPIDLLWLSPDCRHFSKAKGGQPVSKEIRSLADVALKWIDACDIRMGMILENVEEFQTWGPLIQGAKGMMPCPARKGEDFRRYVQRLKDGGATSVEYKVLSAKDYGAPTLRKRLFLIARFDGLPVVWPEPTHGHPDSEDVKSGRLLPYRTAAECIDWSIPCKSVIFRDEPLKDKTNARIAAGCVKFVLNAAKPFIVPITHTSGGNAAYKIDEPLRTITTAKGGEFALVKPVLQKADDVKAGFVVPLTHAGGADRVTDIETPIPTITGANRGEFGLAEVHLKRAEKVLAFMAQHNNGFAAENAGRSVEEPLSTITGRATQQQLVTAHLVKFHKDHQGASVEDPLGTITQREKYGLVYAFLVKYYGANFNGQRLDEPAHTVTSKDRFGLVTVHVEGEEYVVVDIQMRMLTPRELARCQGFDDSYVLDPECWYVTESGRRKFGRLPKTHQIARIGNSVCPVMAKVLTAANFGPRSNSYAAERIAA